MSNTVKEGPKTTIWNLPNQITAARLVISVVVFFLIHFEFYLTGLIFFLLAASTDWVDGRIARRWGQVTQLGRILDPLADKIVICGSFVFLCAIPDSRIAAWMAVVVVGRELVVTVIRSFLEQHGKDFSATMPGKLKMVFQCGAVAASLILLYRLNLDRVGPAWLPPAVTVLAWVAVLSTIYSGVIYIFAAVRLAREL